MNFKKEVVFEPLSMNIKGASAWTGISKSKLWEFIKEGKIKISKPGGRTLIVTKSLKKLIDSGVTQEGM